jgi:hypothetical protein
MKISCFCNTIFSNRVFERLILTAFARAIIETPYTKGFLETFLGIVETFPGTLETFPGTLETFPGIVETFPGFVETFLGIVETFP